MKFNKQLAIILVLGSLLLSALGAAFYFYNMHQTVLEDSNKKVKIYVAKATIKKNQEITVNDLKEHYITKQELLNKPLNAKEIIGKYAVVDIFKNELFIKEKISNKPIEIEEKQFLNHKNNSYNISYRFFRNPNYTLIKGDIIDIVTSYQETTDQLPEYATQYVGKNIKVLGFIYDGQPIAKGVSKMKVMKKVNKKDVQVTQEVKAQEIVLDIQDRTLLALIDDFQKTKNNMWMVKAKSRLTKKSVKKPTPKAKVTQKPKRSAKRSYPYKWFVPKRSVTNAKGTIEYANIPGQISQTKQAKIISNFEEACNKRDKLLLGIADYVYLKSVPNLASRSVQRVYRNYIIPYKQKSGSWYQLCDNNYVHTNEVTEISTQFALDKMSKK